MWVPSRSILHWQLSAALALLLILMGLGASGASAQGSAVRIEVNDNYFSPANQTVHVGDTITWTNNGQRPHTVTARNGAFDSGTLRPGESFSYTVQNEGDIAYYCHFHEGMTATLSVAAAGQGDDSGNGQDDKGNNQGAPHQMPDTGAGGASGSAQWYVVGLAALLLAGLGALRTRRA